MDSDDIIREDTLEILIDKCINYNYKLVYGSYSRDLKEFKMAKKKNNYKIYDTSIYNLDKLLWSGLIWNALIDSDTIKRNNLLFDENLNFGEDTVFKIELLEYIDKVVVIEDILYYWRIVKNSLSSNNGDILNLIKKEYKLLIKFINMINQNYSNNYNTNLIKLIRIKKNSIYNLFFRLNEGFDIKKIDNIRLPLKLIKKSNLNKKDKMMEYIYSIFSFVDSYFIWCILFNMKKKGFDSF